MRKTGFALAAIAALWAVFLCQPSQAAVETADLVCETTATTGTGTVNLGGAATGYLGFVAGGISSGATVPYTIQDGASFEAGWGTFTDASPDTLTRTATNSSDGVGSELNLSGAATVCVGPIASYFRGAYRVGELFWWPPSDTCPAGAIKANGATNLSRTTYADLFAIYGTTFGNDDGSTFGVPDMTSGNRFIRASDGSTITAGTTQADGAPNITGAIGARQNVFSNTGSGSLTLSSPGGTAGPPSLGSAIADRQLDLDASASSAKYGAASEIRPINFAAAPCIYY